MKQVCVGLWILAALCFCCNTAWSQTYKVVVEGQSCGAGGCKVWTQSGSAVCIGRLDGEWIMVSAGHVFHNYTDPLFQGSSQVRSARILDHKENSYPVRVIAYGTPYNNSTNDLAYVALSASTFTGDVPSYPLAEQLPAVGSPIAMQGFPGGGSYSEVKGSLSAVGDFRSDYYGLDINVVPDSGGPGTSGGPVIFNNTVIGIINSGVPHKNTYGTSSNRIRASLMRVLKRIPDCGSPKPAPAPTQPLPPVPPSTPPPAPGCDCVALEAKIKALEAELAEAKKQPSPKTEKRVLYFTSEGHPAVKESDVIARKLKDRGFPITIITLGPEDISNDRVRDVPRIHELPSGRSVAGKSNVITYLTALEI